jgi:hypothetical protein
VVGLGLGTTFRFWSYRRYVFPALLPEAAAPDAVDDSLDGPVDDALSEDPPTRR